MTVQFGQSARFWMLLVQLSCCLYIMGRTEGKAILKELIADRTCLGLRVMSLLPVADSPFGYGHPLLLGHLHLLKNIDHYNPKQCRYAVVCVYNHSSSKFAVRFRGKQTNLLSHMIDTILTFIWVVFEIFLISTLTGL